MLFKYLAFKVVDSISDVIKDHLTWDRIGMVFLLNFCVHLLTTD